MPKVYNENKNVLEAAYERLEFVFNEFDNIYFSISAGKDSSLMMQLAAKVARKLNKKFSILFVDLEAQYKATIEHMEELIEENNDVLDKIYWVCLPLSLRNAVSIIQPKWICWNKDVKEKWVREMPSYSYVINIDNCPFDWFEKGMEFEDFIDYFAAWFNKQHDGVIGTGVAIRTDESLNRFRSIARDDKSKYKDKNWTTQLKINEKHLSVYNFYPIYDWSVEDVWGAVSQFDLSYNEIYEQMYKNGLSIHEQRICQPYGDDQRNGLDQFRALEPETWNKVLNRVSGVNFGNIYCRTSLLGNLKSEKPDHLTWEQYAVFLLETIGIYAPELRDHYYDKISTFIDWYEQAEYEGTGWTEEMGIEDFPDAHPDDKAKNKYPSWERIAWAIERNDFWMKRIGFSQTKGGAEKLKKLQKKYKGFLASKENTDDKHLKEWIENEGDN